MNDYLYLKLERELRQQIESGQLAAGEKMPSIRHLAQTEQLSKATVLSAYERLEADGLVQARTRSGFYVCQSQQQLASPAISSPKVDARTLDQGQILMGIMQRGAAFDLYPGHDSEPSNKKLQRCLGRAQRQQSSAQYLYYDEPLGLPALRKQIQQLMAHGGAKAHEDEIIISNGCQHALLLALLATTRPGDVVAVESPGFYGSLQLIETLGLKALELPCSANEGLSIDALRLATQHWPIKALICSPCFATPTGASMPEEAKQELLNIAKQHDFALIEDDIYGELYFGQQRPRSLYSYDQDGIVLQCSSFSKNLSRDLRLGWLATGRYQQEVIKAKLATSLAVPQLSQQGLSFYIAEGGLDKHLRRKRSQYQERYQEMRHLIQDYLPEETRCSQASGGLAAWIELPKHIDTLTLYEQALEQGIVLTPGRLFTAQDNYRNNLRLSYAHPWTENRIKAFKSLAAMVNANY
ncbi:PLP-dependent aminotransferase family protein [uncultured Pseudoteredinibacter sp.]|uniref:aminotransferase-like domain-containing protein n=1 Tax=uncultured Pseudoteredinibacter sp. TaxID=1641701 RepID=UPI002606A607|nr:PLP-dependent aminotransferase family protein [uncultured Pseudoteredinibacter sp.]